MNWTYTKTGPEMDDMERSDRPNDGVLDGPSASNPIGNPRLPGITSSGGKNWVINMATEFNTTLTLAYIFARSGSTVDDKIIPPRLPERFTFGNQIIHFNDTIGHRPHYAAWTAKNTVATIWFGINDLALAYSREGLEGIDNRLEAANRRIFELTEILYNMGLRQFVFIEVPPVELYPGHQMKKCNEDHKHEALLYAINLWNRALRENTIQFGQTHPDAKATYVDVWDIFYQGFFYPKSLAAINSTCIDPKGKECSKLWADSGHAGRRIHQLVGARVAEKAWGEETM
ncbi:hypothetical protein FSPOR_8761 [Fusarium sporotrichioides]|uniref:SGNH hydrolase-type esterase domain-containing protein n=1 Tax=Fusarium sporotrichioides TaxID=5514 RepID=A0A395RTQ3_FUSSP|nr:hypothetical protein FSPOR_8761 [Fusarium sporotrichioides]